MDDEVKRLLFLGRQHYANQEYFQAQPILTDVIKAGGIYADVYDMLGVIAHSRGDYKTARKHFEQAISINPNYTEARLNLMVTLNDLGEYETAQRLYVDTQTSSDGAPEVDPFALGKIANMHADISQAYQDVGMRFEAIGELEKAIALCPTFADLRVKLGLLYRDAGDRHRAREQFEAAKDANPDYTPARLMLGVLYLGGGNHAAARSEFESVLQKEPENRSAQMYLRLAEHQATAPSSHPPAS